MFCPSLSLSLLPERCPMLGAGAVPMPPWLPCSWLGLGQSQAARLCPTTIAEPPQPLAPQGVPGPCYTLTVLHPKWGKPTHWFQGCKPQGCSWKPAVPELPLCILPTHDTRAGLSTTAVVTELLIMLLLNLCAKSEWNECETQCICKKKDVRKIIQDATMESQVIALTLSVCIYPQQDLFICFVHQSQFATIWLSWTRFPFSVLQPLTHLLLMLSQSLIVVLRRDISLAVYIWIYYLIDYWCLCKVIHRD